MCAWSWDRNRYCLQLCLSWLDRHPLPYLLSMAAQMVMGALLSSLGWASALIFAMAVTSHCVMGIFKVANCFTLRYERWLYIIIADIYGMLKQESPVWSVFNGPANVSYHRIDVWLLIAHISLIRMILLVSLWIPLHLILYNRYTCAQTTCCFQGVFVLAHCYWNPCIHCLALFAQYSVWDWYWLACLRLPLHGFQISEHGLFSCEKMSVCMWACWKRSFAITSALVNTLQRVLGLCCAGNWDYTNCLADSPNSHHFWLHRPNTMIFESCNFTNDTLEKPKHAYCGHL